MLVSLYALLVAGAWLVSLLRREMTVLRGTTVLWLHSAALVAQAGRCIAAPDGACLAALILFGLLTLASAPLRHSWLLSRVDEPALGEIVERSLAQLRIPFERDASGYVLSVDRGAASLELRALPGSHALLRFTLEGGPRKVELLRSLLAKRLGRLLPRPRIRFE